MPTLALLQFALPAMLLGSVAVALPIVAHLRHRRAKRRIVFPSVALLAAASGGRSRLYRLRRRLLLALRCLAVLLIALAFAQPLWWSDTSAGRPAALGDAERVVILLDASASTTQRLAAGRAAFAVLQSDALAALDALRPGVDAAAVVLVSGQPASTFGELTLNHAPLRGSLAAATPTAHRADFDAALRKAAQLLGGGDGPAAPARVVVFTDAQRTNWRDTPASALPPDTTLELRTLDPSLTAAPNAWLEKPGARPASTPLNQPVELSVEVAHDGRDAARLRLGLEVDGRQVDTRALRLEARGRQHVAFTHRFDAAGSHAVRFRLTEADDAVTLDNTAHLVVESVERLPVVVVSDTPGTPGSSGGAAYYLTRALAPRNAAGDRFVVTHLSPSAASPAMLRGAALVCVAEVGLDQPLLRDALGSYVASGGSVLVWGGDAPLRGWDALPWNWVSRREGRSIADAGPPPAELAGFDDTAHKALRGAALGRTWRVGGMHDSTRVLLRFDDGSPALAVRPVGDGRVAAAAFSPGSGSGSLGRYGVFVALVQSLAEGLTADRRVTPTRFAGRALGISAHVTSGATTAGATLVGPEGEALPDTMVTLSGQTLTAYTQAAPIPGVYRLMGDEKTIGRSAVNVDPRESDLTRDDAAVLARSLEVSGVTVAASAAGAADGLQGGASRPRPLWGIALLMLLAVLCAEMMLLGWWR